LSKFKKYPKSDNIRIICFFIGLQLSFFSCFSQIRWGLKGGANLETTTIRGLASDYYRWGINGGGFTEIKIGTRFFILPELLYSLKGNSVFDGNFNLNYINLPVMAGFILVGRLSVVLGPEFGFLLNANVKASDASTEGTDQTRRVDIGLGIGFRYGFCSKWGADLRYINGVRGLSPSKTDCGPGCYGMTDEKHNLKNRVFQLGLYYNLH
jgi:Outer membrane protein beta-barrel domain